MCQWTLPLLPLAAAAAAPVRLRPAPVLLRPAQVRLRPAPLRSTPRPTHWGPPVWSPHLSPPHRQMPPIAAAPNHGRIVPCHLPPLVPSHLALMPAGRPTRAMVVVLHPMMSVHPMMVGRHPMVRRRTMRSHAVWWHPVVVWWHPLRMHPAVRHAAVPHLLIVAPHLLLVVLLLLPMLQVLLLLMLLLLRGLDERHCSRRVLEPHHDWWVSTFHHVASIERRHRVLRRLDPDVPNEAASQPLLGAVR